MAVDRDEALLRGIRDIRAYTRITAARSLRETAGRLIDTHEKALVFSKLDGSTTQPKLEEITGVPQATISRWLGEFTEAGIVALPDETYKSHRALFTVQELGIDSPTLKKRKPYTVSKKTETTTPETV